MMKKHIVIAGLAVVLAASLAHAVPIGFFPGLDELIERADAIVILRVDRHVTDFGSPTLYSTHDCYIYQTLKGDIPTNKTIRLQLMDTRTSFVTPYAIHSTHLMFLTNKRTGDEPTDYRTIEIRGANIRLTPFGHEKMPAGKTTKDQIRSLLKRTVEYNEKQHDKERAFLEHMIKGTAEPTGAPAKEIKDQPDQLCQMLFDGCIARRGKINTSTVMAASHIVAGRGRNTGFWTTVLRELQKGEEQSEIGCVRVLGKMLAIDAAARDVIRREKETGETGQWQASICLGPEVVTELVERGKKADRFRVDHYAIALARARVPEAKDFFRMILRDDTGKHYMASAKFHAAVGLAQLSHPTGFEWLIANSGDPLPTISNAWPPGVPDLNVNTCCVAALRHLSGENKLSTKQEWQTWWKTVDKKLLPKSHVTLVDP